MARRPSRNRLDTAMGGNRGATPPPRRSKTAKKEDPERGNPTLDLTVGGIMTTLGLAMIAFIVANLLNRGPV